VKKLTLRIDVQAPERLMGLAMGQGLASKAAALFAVVCLGVAPLSWAQSPTPSAPTSPSAARKAATPAPIFVLNSLDANLSIIDPVTFKELRRVPTGKEPHHLYLSPDEKSLLVANALSDSISMFDPRTGTLQKVVTGIADPYQLKFSPDMKWFITAANRLNHVDIYHVVNKPGTGLEFTLSKRVATGKTPSHIAVDSKSTVTYVSMQDSDELIAIDLATQQPRWKIPVGKMPADVFITPNDKFLLVALTGDKFVEVYDVSGPKPVLHKRLETADGAHAFRAWGDKRHVMLSNRVANTISKIDLQTLTVVDSFPAPGGPDCMDLLADGKTILVTSRWARKLTMIDTVQKKVIRQVNVGRSPHGVWTLDHAPR
jgi:YVTN family beta-propeller protein